MSNFLDSFRSFFTSEERESELYRILSMVGVNTEKTIFETLDSEIRGSTELSAFSDDKIKSWLSFFLTPVRNVLSAHGFGRLVVTGFSQGTASQVDIPAGSVVVSRGGCEYTLRCNIMVSNIGDSVGFSFVQGRLVTTEVEYSEFISIPVKSGVDLSYVTVSIDGVFIPVISSFPTVPFNLNSNLDMLNNNLEQVLQSYSPASSIGRFTATIDSMWDSINAVSVIPREGFFPFFYNGNLFIKIYAGAFSNSIDPEGKKVIVSYLLSDGAKGNIGEDELDHFMGSFTSASGDILEYTLFNMPVINGYNPPSRGELLNLLRRRFFASTHVSSIPEYTIWFLSQPGIGDCVVLSDFSSWMNSKSGSFTGFDITGVVKVYLLDTEGGVINPFNLYGGYTHFIQCKLRLKRARSPVK